MPPRKSCKNPRKGKSKTKSRKGFEVRMGATKDVRKLIWTALTLEDAKFIAKIYAQQHPTQFISVNREP